MRLMDVRRLNQHNWKNNNLSVRLWEDRHRK